MDITYRFNPFAPLVSSSFRTADEVLQRLREGHQAYRELIRQLRSAAWEGGHESLVLPRSFLSPGVSLVPGAAPPQRPFAIVLSCSDARVPVEELFQVHANGVFVVRVAGQALGTECLGSVLYALEHFRDSVRLIAVLGHTGCGAVTAAVDSLLQKNHLTESQPRAEIQSLIDKLTPAVRLCADSADIAPTSAFGRASLIESAGYVHAARTAMELRNEAGSLAGSGVRVVYGAFDLRRIQVQSRPQFGAAAQPDNFLAEAPHTPAELAALARDLGSSFVELPEADSITSLMMPVNCCTLAG